MANLKIIKGINHRAVLPSLFSGCHRGNEFFRHDDSQVVFGEFFGQIFQLPDLQGYQFQGLGFQKKGVMGAGYKRFKGLETTNSELLPKLALDYPISLNGNYRF